MPTYAYTVNPPTPQVTVSPATGYVAVDETGTELLDYATTVMPVTANTGTNAATNYRLAFSIAPPTPHPSIGQIWPRGAGQA